MVLRTLTVITRGLAAGLVLGAKVPIVVTWRGESMEARMASCVLASLVASRSRAAANSTTSGKPARNGRARGWPEEHRQRFLGTGVRRRRRNAANA